jgi:RNA polymerase primary sigma factor
MFTSSRGLDSFDQYLQDVEKYPLIQNPAEERALARRARSGDKEAAERLVTANLRFVISYVKKYQGRGLGLAELVCIGNEGLLKAVKKFDPDKGVKFISYAVWWIRQTVLQALAEQTRSVRIPLNQNSNLAKLARVDTALTQQLGRSPTMNEISREMEEPIETIRGSPASKRLRSSRMSRRSLVGSFSKRCSTAISPSARERSSTSTTVWMTARKELSKKSVRCSA